MRVVIALLGAILVLFCRSSAGQVIPDYYSEPGLNSVRDYLNQNATEYIDPFSGTLHLSYVDLLVPGNGGLDIKVQRNYNTISYDRNLLGIRTVTGVGWKIHFGRVLNRDGDVCSNLFVDLRDNPVLELPDGTQEIFFQPNPIPGVSPTPWWITKNRWKAECDTSVPTLGLIVTSPEGVEYRMNKRDTFSCAWGACVWYTTQIKDRNGNTINISYIDQPSSGHSLINQVTSSDGRLVTFQYVGSGTPDVRLSSITANGQTWTYNYTLITDFAGNYYQLASVVRPDALSWSYAYNPRFTTGAAGSYELQRVTYPYGGTISYSYGLVNFDACSGSCSNNTVVTQKVTGGVSVTPGTWTFAYNPDWLNPGVNDVTTVTTPNGRYVYSHFGFTTAGNGTVWRVGLLLKKETFSSASVLLETEEYTWGSQLISNDDYVRPTRPLYTDLSTNAPILTQKKVTRDGTAYTTSFSGHDEFGNPTTVSETGNATRTTTLTYFKNVAKWIVKQIDDETITGIGTIARGFDANGNLSSENRYGVTTTYTRFATGDVNTVTDARTKVTTFLNYSRGIPQTEQHPEARTITRVVSGAGVIASETNGEGAITGYTYDTLNRLTGINHPINNDVTITWALRSKTLTRGNFQDITTFDGFGHPTRSDRKDTTRGITIFKTMSYDALGRKTFESYLSSASGTSFAYDVLDRLTSVTHPGGAVKSLAYLAGNAVRVTNERGKVLTYTYRSFGDPNGRALMVLDTPVANADITIQRNLIDKITQVTQGTITATYGYDTRFFLTSTTRPETGTSTFGRDAVGNMTSRQVATSPITTFTYDGLNRLTTINYPGTTPDVQNTYNRNNKLTQVSTFLDAVTFNTRTYQYDANQNLTQDTLAIDGGSATVTYGYDLNDNLNTITYPSGLVVTYAPDALGRPTQALPQATSVSHHPSGQVSGMTFANGANTTITFNARYWPGTLAISGANAVPLVNSTYGYDNGGNLTSVTDTVDTNYNRTLTYDDLDRLVTADSPVWGTGSMSYSGWGDLLTQNLGTEVSLSYSYDTANRLAGVSGTHAYSFSYDAYGNAVNNGSSAFTYDDASNLVCANCGLPTQADYTYDGKKLRVKAVKNGVTTYSFYAHNGNLLFENDPAVGNTDYVYIKDQLIAQSGANSLSYHNDVLGSPLAATDAAGAPLWRENFQPYGRKLLNQGNSTNSLWFTGKSHDEDTKLSYFGARFYDPLLGRFMGVDPQDFDETNLHSFNRYAYGNNNPYKFKDSDGNSPVSVFLMEVAKQTGAGYLLGVGADAISQYAAFGQVDFGMAATSNAAIAGGASGLLSGTVSGAVKGIATAREAAEIAKTAGDTVRTADNWSRTPKNLMDQMVLDAAKQGKGQKIIDNLGDPRFKGMEKWSYGETSANGVRSEVHYVRDPKTGQLTDFKFKHHAEPN